LRRDVPICHEALSPAGQHHNDDVRSGHLHSTSDGTPVDIGHPEIRNHDGERIITGPGFVENIDPCLAAVGAGDAVAVRFQRFSQRFKHQRIVIHYQNSLRWNCFDRARRRGADHYGYRHRETKANRSTRAQSTLDFKVGTMPLYGAIYHCETETRTPLALGAEERFDASTSRIFVHSDSRVGYFEFNELRSHNVCRIRIALRAHTRSQR
jgi:hypothetical protein